VAFGGGEFQGESLSASPMTEDAMLMGLDILISCGARPVLVTFVSIWSPGRFFFLTLFSA